MRKMSMFGAAFFAVHAFGSVVAMNASATLWLDSLSESPLAEESGTAHGLGSWEASDGTVIHCEGLSDGAVGPGAAGLIQSALNSSGELISSTKPMSCAVLKAGVLCKLNELALVYPVGLPWKTLLVLISGVTFIEGSGSGKGEPGGHIECTTAKVTDECTGKDRAKFIKNTASGAEFSDEGELEVSCTNIFAPKAKLKGKATVLGFTVS